MSGRQRGWLLDSQSGGHEFPQSCACSSDQVVDSGGDLSVLPFCTKAFIYSIYHSHGNKCTLGLSTALLQGFTITPLNSSKIILARWLVYLYLAALYRIFSPQRKSAIVRALRKASKQSLTSSNTGYALSMAGYYLFGRKTSSLVSRKDVPKILIVITDGRWVSYIVVTVSVFRCLITRIAFTCMRIYLLHLLGCVDWPSHQKVPTSTARYRTD